MRIHTYACIYTSTDCACTIMQAQLCKHIHTYACIYTPMHAYTHLCMVHSPIPTYACVYPLARVYPPMHTHTHLRMRITTYAHIRSRADLVKERKEQGQDRPCQGEERTRSRRDLVKERKEQGAGQTLSRRGKNKEQEDLVKERKEQGAGQTLSRRGKNKRQDRPCQGVRPVRCPTA